MSPRRKTVVTIEYDDRGAPVDRVTAPPPGRPAGERGGRVTIAVEDDHDGTCGWTETYRDLATGITHALRCTRAVRDMGGRLRHFGVHYDRVVGLWFDRVQYPNGKLRAGRVGDHLR